ncbi:MAG: AMP-binding protein [Oceanobacillus sp.]|nr:AMP-binding protein [Oceanobacillus sp.]
MLYDINWFESRVQLTPKDIAIIDSETKESWTYEELYERVIKVSNFFHTKGVRKGDRVAILAPNHISYFDFFFASMKIGAIFVPLNWRVAKAELHYCINDCDPKVIGVNPDFKANLDAAETNGTYITIDTSNYIDDLYYEQATFDGTLHEEDPLAMIYTGGTTGCPKGVVLSHKSILWNALNTIVSWGLSKEDTTLTCLPMFHTGGLNVLSLPLLLSGGKVVLLANFDASQVIEELLQYKCTIAMLVPTMYHMMIETKTFKTATFPDMKVFVSGGAPCPYKVYEAFSKKGIAFKEGYGLTEAGPNNFYIDPKDAMHKLGSVGKPMLFNDIKIMKDEEVITTVDEVGELYIRGSHAFTYYWNRPEETKTTLIDGWIRTGDIARQDADGYFYIVGRKKDMIITGGENVYPLEIEHWLEAHPAIDEAAVIGLPDEKWGEAVVACIVTEKVLTVEELEDYCKQQLTRYKVPKQFFFLTELPKTDVGKVNKKTLKLKYSNHTDSTIS